MVEKLRMSNIDAPIILINVVKIRVKDQRDYNGKNVYFIEKSKLQERLLRLIRELLVRI
ncbi:hypothetical protein JXJ21_03840 [candidate division KSB1 bacterium]|nr:hypothetical protein [candidate division KSB1 bacterium]